MSLTKNDNMKLTTDHLRFYQAKKTPVPKWSAQIAKTPWRLERPGNVSIHTLINAQVPRVPRHEAGNLIHLVQLVQRTHDAGVNPFPETVRDFLRRIASNYCPTDKTYLTVAADTRRRIGYARKWSKRLTKND